MAVKASAIRVEVGIAVLLLVASMAPAQTPLGSAFMYQGRLTDGGAPATGVYDLEFKLFDASTGGGQVGATQLKDNVSVAEGLFTVTLDFGAAAFAGSARWLSIGVRPGSSTGAFTLLNSRQELKPSPNAIFSQAVPWSGVSGKPAGFADDTDDDSGGDITGVTAGSGLTGGGATGTVALNVDFSGSSGAANAAARSDHNHFGQVWGGSTGASGLRVENSSTTGFAQGLYGQTASNGGRAVQGSANSTSGQTFSFWGRNFSTEGTGVFGEHFAVTGVEPGVLGQTHSTTGSAVGVLGIVVPTSPGGNSAAVRGINNGTGALGIGVYGSQAGGGWGVNGTTVSGIGVRGLATADSGVGVRAIGSGTNGTALEISSGAIRVVGAGVGTNTAVFVHHAVAGNTCTFGPFRNTVIDNPFANGDPDAILIVTPRDGISGYLPFPTRIWYGSPCGVADRWSITWDQEFPSENFNVLVIKP